MIEQKKLALLGGLLEDVQVGHLQEEDHGHLLGVVDLPVDGADLLTGESEAEEVDHVSEGGRAPVVVEIAGGEPEVKTKKISLKEAFLRE